MVEAAVVVVVEEDAGLDVEQIVVVVVVGVDMVAQQATSVPLKLTSKRYTT